MYSVLCAFYSHNFAGTEDMDKENKDYLFHVKGCAIGTTLGLVVALLAGGIVHLM